jgi:SAM-dependent methyltransferase
MNTMNVYLEEYSADEAVRKYVSHSAGSGIAYLLEHVYGPLYDDQIGKLVRQNPNRAKFRLLEYGCGGGMNLIWIVSRLLNRNLQVDLAVGTDFSAKMVAAAKQEAARALPGASSDLLSFHTVANENLASDLPKEVGLPLAELENSFDLIVGVNTFRYCFRLGAERKSAGDIFSLLRPGGLSVMIDMNRLYPFFRSKWRRSNTPKSERFLPSLAQYADVFQKAGFEIETKKNFCWVPHSASPRMVSVLSKTSPVLQSAFSPFAMRSLIVARKPL